MHVVWQSFVPAAQAQHGHPALHQPTQPGGPRQRRERVRVRSERASGRRNRGAFLSVLLVLPRARCSYRREGILVVRGDVQDVGVHKRLTRVHLPGFFFEHRADRLDPGVLQERAPASVVPEREMQASLA